MSGKEGSVYSPTFDMDMHEGPEAAQKIELRRMMLYHGFQTLVDNNTPLLCSREETTSFKAIVKRDAEEEKIIDITCDRLLIGPSCWAPDSVPLDISVFLPDNKKFFSLRPFGKGYVMSGLSIARPQVIRAMNLGDILRLETVLSHINNPDTKIDQYHTGKPRRY